MWKLGPLGYISRTKWPDSKSIRGPRLPPGIFFFLSRLFLKFLQCSRIFCCPKKMFPFSSRNQHLRILWIPVHFPGPLSYSGSPGGFFLVLSFTPCQRLYHVTCPPVTGFHPGPGEIWPVVSSTVSKYFIWKWLQMAPSQRNPRNSVDRWGRFRFVQSGIQWDCPSQLPAASRVDFRRTVLDRDVVCKALLTHQFTPTVVNINTHMFTLSMTIPGRQASVICHCN